MTTRFGSRIQTTILIGALLMVSICTSLKTSEATTGKADDTTRVTIATGKFVNESEMIGVLPSFSATKSAADDNTEDRDQADRETVNREASVNVMSAPSLDSRTVAELRHGQAIKVLKAKDSWLKITWQTDNTLSQGWLEKAFVEGTTIHAHR